MIGAEIARTKEFGKMLQQIQILKHGRVLAKEARHGKIEGQKRRITRNEYSRLWNEFETGGFMAQKVCGIGLMKGCWETEVHCPRGRRLCGRVQGHSYGLWNVARENMSQDRGAWLEEEGDIVRAYKAMHERKCLKQLAEGRRGWYRKKKG